MVPQPHNDKESPRPAAPLRGASVLTLDIDGALAPMGHGGNFDIRNPPPYFLEGPIMMGPVPYHPSLGAWLEQLAGAYEHVVWASSWAESAARFGRAVHPPAAAWPTVYPCRDSQPPKDINLKLWGILGSVSPETPLAIVDDDAPEWPCPIRGGSPALAQAMRERRAPTLVLAPDYHVGLGRRGVDLLCRFAASPASFESSLHMLYSNPLCAWPMEADRIPEEPEHADHWESYSVMGMDLLTAIEQRDLHWGFDGYHKFGGISAKAKMAKTCLSRMELGGLYGNSVAASVVKHFKAAGARLSHAQTLAMLAEVLCATWGGEATRWRKGGHALRHGPAVPESVATFVDRMEADAGRGEPGEDWPRLAALAVYDRLVEVGYLFQAEGSDQVEFAIPSLFEQHYL